MGSNIKISIPTPCHENWAGMSPTQKGRFCNSCQKQVVDFTKAGDRQIAEAYKADKHLCGRFLTSQLDRELVVPTKKSSLWAAASAAVISFFVLGSQKAVAQGEPARIEASPAKSVQNDTILKMDNTIRGTVYNNENLPMPGVTVKNLSTKKSVATDVDGEYTIEATQGDTLEFSFIGLQTTAIKVSSSGKIDTQLLEQEISTGIIVYSGKERSFFGRIFYRIGNLFR